MTTTLHDDLYAIAQEYEDFRDLVRRIATERVAPRAAEIDQTDEYPWDIRQLLAEQDILGLPFAEEHGGLGTGNGLGGGIVAMTVGLVGITLGGLALARSRRIA